MKYFLLLTFFFFMNTAHSFMANCPPGTMRSWHQAGGYSCLPRLQHQHNPLLCGLHGDPMPTNPFQQFPSPLYQPQVLPWWAYQGSLYYPNVRYPGPWHYPGIQSHHYPGSGEVFAAKPNVYIDSIHKEKKFSFNFISQKMPEFLATTPILGKSLSWSGKIIQSDKFEVDGIYYDYLFYDVRLPKEKMQFKNGLCATRDGAIEWMMRDLIEMKFSAISLQDFEEHWRVKIPDYPFYCIYPQYNRELDPILPVEIGLEQSSFIRSLYVLVPHKKEPDFSDPQEIPLPAGDPGEYRPGSKIKRENMFREWGVAFLGY